MDQENTNENQNNSALENDAFSQPLILEESASLLEDSDEIIENTEVEDDNENIKSKKDEIYNKKEHSEMSENGLQWEKSQDLFDVNEGIEQSLAVNNEIPNGLSKIATVSEIKSDSVNSDTDDKTRQNKRKGDSNENDESNLVPMKILKTNSTENDNVLKSTSRNSTESNTSISVLSGKINLSFPKLIKTPPESESSVEIVLESNSIEKVDLVDTTNSEKSENGDVPKSTIENSSDEQIVSTASVSSPPNLTEDILGTNNANISQENKTLDEKMINISNDKHNESFKSDTTMECQLLTEKQNATLRKHTFWVEITYSINDPLRKEIMHVNCEEITDFVQPKRMSDVSAGALGDVSKNTSPNSSVSLGPFQLPNRFSTISNGSRLSTLSRFSTSSTSSMMSSASALAAKMREEHFVIPEVPQKNKDKSPLPGKIMSQSQIQNIQSHWSNTEQLFKILDAVDSSYCNGKIVETEKVSPVHLEPKNGIIDQSESSPTESKLEKIEEICTPKSEKRSVRKKRPLKSSDETETEASLSSSKVSLRVGSGRKKRSDSINQRLMTPEPVQPNSHISLKQEVFARWTDKKYYSGIIEEHYRDNKWMIKFDDGNKKVLSEEYIIPGCHTLLKGHSVFAIGKDEDYDSGIVTKLWVDRGKVCYDVETDNGTVVKVSPDQLFLTEDQARAVKEIIHPMTPPVTPKQTGGVVSLENIIEGKRSTRANRKYSDSIVSPRPGVSGMRKLTPRKLDSEDDKSIDSRSECCALEEIGGVEPEMKISLSTPSKANKGPGKVKGNLKRSKRVPKYKMNEDLLNNELGPIPSEDSDIFKGLSFILVCANISSPNDRDEITSHSGTDTENEMMEFTKVPYLEERLKQQIIAGGGIIYNHFEEVPADEYNNCKLVANRPNRTAKYIQCIAADIMVISHEWIVNCCRENQRLSFQELPVGWSVEKIKFIDSFHRTNKQPFKDLLIYLAPNIDKQFLKFWQRVCTLAGGTVIIMDKEEIDFQTATFVLADNECPEQIVDRASNWGIPLLSTTWIIQSIIHGECRAFDGHPKYAYDSIEYD